MRPIHVILAEKSFLVHLGLTGILNQTGFSLSIKSITQPDKFIGTLKKEKKGLLIVSKSFLSEFNDELLSRIRSLSRYYNGILINDSSQKAPNSICINEMIEQNDPERIIYLKIDKCLRRISNPESYNRPTDEISQREKEVLKLVAIGLTNKEISDRLYISMHTVITHRKNITSKLGIKTIAGLTVYAFINKLVSAEDIK